jgi:hypothetical protein
VSGGKKFDLIHLRGLFGLLYLVLFFLQGAGLGALPILASEIFTVIIFILAVHFSYKNGFQEVKKIDIVYLVIALVSIIPWYLTSDPTISVVTVVFIDVIAFIPTIRKTYTDPASENYVLFLMNACRHILILLSLDVYNVATTFHSIVMIVTNALMTYIILFVSRLKV